MSSIRALFESFLKTLPAEHQTADSTLQPPGAFSVDPNKPKDLDPPKKETIREEPTPSPNPVTLTTRPPVNEFTTATRQVFIDMSTYLSAFVRTSFSRTAIEQTNSYIPSFKLGMFIIHCMNTEMVNSFFLNRAVPQYDPMFLRYYMSVLFYIQVYRCMLYCNKLDPRHRVFLTQFLEDFPPESLPIPGPTSAFFKAISASHAENPVFGKVFPRVPVTLGHDGAQGAGFCSIDSNITLILPQVPAIIGFINWLRSNVPIPTDQPAGAVPAVNRHASVAEMFGNAHYSPFSDAFLNTNAGVIIGGQNYPAIYGAQQPQAAAAAKLGWNARLRWQSDSCGTDYVYEGNNTSFNKLRSTRLHIPTYDNAADYTDPESFLFLTDRTFFTECRNMVGSLCDFWAGSSTLAEASVNGLYTGQIVTRIRDPQVAVIMGPDYSDTDTNFWFIASSHNSTKLESHGLSDTIAFATQTNIRTNHANFGRANQIGQVGAALHKRGEFWNIRPVLATTPEDRSYLNASFKVTEMFINSNVSGKTKAYISKGSGSQPGFSANLD